MVREQKSTIYTLAEPHAPVAVLGDEAGSGLPLSNLARLDLVSLKLAVACANEGSLTRAAPLCNMSLMTASRRLRMLEDTLECTLFYRRCKSLELTKAGAYVVETSRQVLALIDVMKLRVLSAPSIAGHMHQNPGRSLRGRRTTVGKIEGG